ncbi:MAG: hypothetical protein K8M05_02375 [Deltaproteobacteria bacterium]|nr:hypothetical protein [Kofleriaceae bacterium]
MTYQHNELTRRVLESLVPVICPPEVMELGIGADIVDHVALTMSAVPPLFRRGLVLGLASYDLAALAWLPGRGRRAHQLPPELAERYYERWEHGLTPVGHELAKAIGQLLKLACYEHPVMQERLGYRPQQWIEEVKRRRLTVYADDVRKAEAAILAPDPLRPPIGNAKERV